MRVAKCSTLIRPVRLWEVRLSRGDKSKDLDSFIVHVILFIVLHHDFLSAWSTNAPSTVTLDIVSNSSSLQDFSRLIKNEQLLVLQ